MLGLGNKNQGDETVKNPPSDDSYPMTSILLFFENNIDVMGYESSLGGFLTVPSA